MAQSSVGRCEADFKKIATAQLAKDATLTVAFPDSESGCSVAELEAIINHAHATGLKIVNIRECLGLGPYAQQKTDDAHPLPEPFGFPDAVHSDLHAALADSPAGMQETSLAPCGTSSPTAPYFIAAFAALLLLLV